MHACTTNRGPTDAPQLVQTQLCQWPPHTPPQLTQAVANRGQSLSRRAKVNSQNLYHTATRTLNLSRFAQQTQVAQKYIGTHRLRQELPSPALFYKHTVPRLKQIHFIRGTPGIGCHHLIITTAKLSS